MVGICYENLEPGLPPGPKKYDIHANLDVWGPVKVGRWAKKEVVLSNCVHGTRYQGWYQGGNGTREVPSLSGDVVGQHSWGFGVVLGYPESSDWTQLDKTTSFLVHQLTLTGPQTSKFA